MMVLWMIWGLFAADQPDQRPQVSAPIEQLPGCDKIAVACGDKCS
jgi:hypothetical protein